MLMEHFVGRARYAPQQITDTGNTSPLKTERNPVNWAEWMWGKTLQWHLEGELVEKSPSHRNPRKIGIQGLGAIRPAIHVTTSPSATEPPTDACVLQMHRRGSRCKALFQHWRQTHETRSSPSHTTDGHRPLFALSRLLKSNLPSKVWITFFQTLFPEFLALSRNTYKQSTRRCASLSAITKNKL